VLNGEIEGFVKAALAEALKKWEKRYAQTDWRFTILIKAKNLLRMQRFTRCVAIQNQPKFDEVEFD
jgi:hypothetical protein